MAGKKKNKALDVWMMQKCWMNYESTIPFLEGKTTRNKESRIFNALSSKETRENPPAHTKINKR